LNYWNIENKQIEINKLKNRLQIIILVSVSGEIKITASITLKLCDARDVIGSSRACFLFVHERAHFCNAYWKFAEYDFTGAAFYVTGLRYETRKVATSFERKVPIQ